MGIFDKIFGKKSVKSEKNRGANYAMADKLIEMIREETLSESVNIRLRRGESKAWSSKVGGTPYMPEGFEYPYDKTEGREEIPLRFLAQINFSEVPQIKGFPEAGILQFFIADDDAYGINFEELTIQKGFRTIFHETVSMEGSLIETMPEIPESEDRGSFPISDELIMIFEKGDMAMSTEDFRFDPLLVECYNKLNPSNTKIPLELIPEHIIDHVYDALSANGHHIGGYPAFTQMDPREYREELQEDTILLLQLDSEESEEYSIIWGDMGVCHFFIRPDDLARKDFSDVLYSWDCY